MARKSRKRSLTAGNCKKYKVGIYARLSADKESESIENQIGIVREYFKDKEDCEIVMVYEEKGVSGGTFFRSVFNKMKEDIEKGLVNCIGVKDLSRLGRNYIETAYCIEKFFPEKGIRFVAVTDMYDNEYVKSGINLTVPFKNMLNEFYIRDISMKISSALNAKRKGKHTGAVPYGYERNKDGVLIPNERAEYVRMIYSLSEQGVGCSRIADILNEMGVPTPSAGRYGNGGCGYWREGTIRNILSNRVYRGVLIQHKTVSAYKTTADGRRKKVRKKNGLMFMTVYENNHEGIL